MNTRRRISEIVHGAGRPIGHPATKHELARLLAETIGDATPNQMNDWAAEIASEQIDLGEAARWIEAIRRARPRSPGAYYNACRKNAKKRSA